MSGRMEDSPRRWLSGERWGMALFKPCFARRWNGLCPARLGQYYGRSLLLMLINGLDTNERRLALIEAHFCFCDAMSWLKVHERPIGDQLRCCDRLIWL